MSLLPLDFEPSHKIELGQKDLENVALLYTTIKTLRGSISDAEDARLTDVFDRHLQKVIDELNHKLAGITDPYLRQGVSFASSVNAENTLLKFLPLHVPSFPSNP